MYVLVAACCDAEAGAARPTANGCSEMAELTINLPGQFVTISAAIERMCQRLVANDEAR